MQVIQTKDLRDGFKKLLPFIEVSLVDEALTTNDTLVLNCGDNKYAVAKYVELGTVPKPKSLGNGMFLFRGSISVPLPISFVPNSTFVSTANWITNGSLWLETANVKLPRINTARIDYSFMADSETIDTSKLKISLLTIGVKR